MGFDAASPCIWEFRAQPTHTDYSELVSESSEAVRIEIHGARFREILAILKTTWRAFFVNFLIFKKQNVRFRAFHNLL